MFGPLTTIGSEVPDWFAVLSALLDWSADWLGSDPPWLAVWVWPAPLDWSFVCVAELVFDAFTMLPLFWFVVPPPPQGLQELPLATAMLGALATIGSDVPLWFAVLEPSFDCVAVCETAGSDGGVRRSP